MNQLKKNKNKLFICYQIFFEVKSFEFVINSYKRIKSISNTIIFLICA